MTVLQELVAALDAASELLAQDRDPFKRAWGRHLAIDAKAMRALQYKREPADVEAVK